MRYIIPSLSTAFVLALLPQPSSAQQLKTIVHGANLSCPEYFKEGSGVCLPILEKITPLEKSKCQGKGLAFVAGKCAANEADLPTPTCSGGAFASQFDPEIKQCVVSKEPQQSANGDYLGDCFRIWTDPKGSHLEGASSYFVVHQSKVERDDRELTLAKGGDGGNYFCKRDESGKAKLVKVQASQLVSVGADRTGWTYGVLALPYKYHTADRSFSPSLSLGPYVGRRWGKPGSAYTFALAATLGTVKGEIRDAQGAITSTPDIQAFSLAAGYMFDIAKSSELRPFKLGLFVGTDVVGSDSAVKYKHNRKPWLALQIGWDFTEN